MNYAAILYDMDGLMIDSHTHWTEADKKFWQANGLSYTEDMVKEWKPKLMGRSVPEGTLMIKEFFGLQKDDHMLIAERVAFTDTIYSEHSQPMPGINQLLRTVSKTPIIQAIASGSSLSRIEMVVNRFGWAPYLAALVSTDHVAHKGKPAPDVYLYAAKQVNVLPDQCVVIEDAPNGIESAKAAGMACIAVPDPRWSHEMFEKADLIVPSLEDPRVYTFLGV